MALPKLNTPTYELEVPSTDEKIKYRPFLVKEEKILLMAMESKDNAQIINAVKEIVKSCTFEKVDVSSMPMFDMEYIFLNIRAKSVGEISKIKVLCPDDKTTYANVELDLSKVEVQVDDEHNNTIEINDKVKMIMKYPTIDSFAESGIKDITPSNMLEVISTCILQIFEDEGKKVYYKNITLGYNIPGTIIKGVSSIRISAGVNNLYTFTNYTGFDPEVGDSNPFNGGLDRGNYPISATYLTGLSISF